MWTERESSLADPHGGPAATEVIKVSTVPVQIMNILKCVYNPHHRGIREMHPDKGTCVSHIPGYCRSAARAEGGGTPYDGIPVPLDS